MSKIKVKIRKKKIVSCEDFKVHRWKCADIKVESHSYEIYIWINGIRYTIFRDDLMHMLTDEELEQYIDEEK